MVGVDLLLFAGVGFLSACLWLGSQVHPEKKEKKTPEKEFAEALEKYLEKGIPVRTPEEPKEKKK